MCFQIQQQIGSKNIDECGSSFFIVDFEQAFNLHQNNIKFNNGARLLNFIHGLNVAISIP